MMRGWLLLCGVGILWTGDAAAQHLDHAAPALAKIEGGEIVVRQFFAETPPLPGEEIGNRPRTESREHHLRFHVRDLQAFSPDGKPVSDADWHRRLTVESPVLFGSYALSSPGQPAPRRPNLNLPKSFAKMYRADALVLLGNASPIKQTPVQNSTALPKGSPPRFGSALVWKDGQLHVFETSEARMHYYAPLPTQGQTHIFQTTETTVTRTLPPGDARVFDRSGRQISAASFSETFREHTPVAVSSDGQPVDPFYLQLLKPETLSVVVPLPPQRRQEQGSPYSPR